MDKLETLLSNFGLKPEEVEIYIFLLKNGEQTVLEVARNVTSSRTKVYRILEDLDKQGFVTIVMSDRGKRFKANSPEKLDLIISAKEEEIQKLKKSKEELIKQLPFFIPKSDKKSKVLYYEGKEGLRQITWNSLKADGELRIFEIGQTMDSFTTEEFAEKVREEFMIRKVYIYQLTNFEKIEPYTNLQQFADNWWEVRYIDPKELSLNFEMVIYNDVLAMYTYRDNEAFGIEIQNSDLVRMQVQIFDFLWSKGRRMKIGKGGKAWLDE
jgi:sugar-specific transcriptional regulator TrmB